MANEEVNQELLTAVTEVLAEVGSVELKAGQKTKTLTGKILVHDDVIGKMNVKTRFVLSHNHKIVVEHGRDAQGNVVPVKIFVRDASKVIQPQPQAPEPLPDSELKYALPPFYKSLLLNFRCAKDFATNCSRNVLLYGHKGCVIGTTKIKIKKVGNGHTPIETVLD